MKEFFSNPQSSHYPCCLIEENCSLPSNPHSLSPFESDSLEMPNQIEGIEDRMESLSQHSQIHSSTYLTFEECVMDIHLDFQIHILTFLIQNRVDKTLE